MAGQCPFSFSVRRPLAAKWARASARNCGRRIAGRDACPTRGWVKSAPPAVQLPAVPTLSALRGEVAFWGYPASSFVLGRLPKPARTGPPSHQEEGPAPPPCSRHTGLTPRHTGRLTADAWFRNRASVVPLCVFLHPADELLLWHHHPTAHLQHREAWLAHQLVFAGWGHAQHLCHHFALRNSGRSS